MATRLVIGLVGDIGSGKGTVADYLESGYGFHKHIVSDFIRSEARKRKIKPNRKNLERLSEELRQKFGIDYFIQKVIRKIEKDGDEKVAIDGIRLASDVKLVKNYFKHGVKIMKNARGVFHSSNSPSTRVQVIFVTAPARLRFDRMKHRGRPGDPKKWADFLELEKREEKEFHLKKVFAMADYVIDASGSMMELYKKIDALLKRLN